ncbi:MAG: helix-turn-helix transcriptional regulator [Bacteroidales bacterium]|nr:helix-turn-helix transcriptional regulator [Bacteroidales bacterium]
MTETFIRRLLQYHQEGHPNGHPGAVRAPAGPPLTDREKEILVLLIQGKINKEIADRLDISVTTVIFHRNNICQKLGTRSLGRLTIYAVLAGLVDIDEI